MANASNIKAGKAYVSMGADNSDLKRDLREAEDDLKQFGKAAEKVGGASYANLTANVKALKREQRVSGESALVSVLRGGPEEIAGTLIDALGAGAAAVGIEFFANSLKSAGENAAKIRSEFAAGKISWGEMVENAAASIPIFGGVWEAGRAIRDAFFGDLTAEKVEMEQIKRESEGTLDLINAQAAAADHFRQMLSGIRMEAMRVRTATAGIGADPFTRERLAIAQGAAERAMTGPPQNTARINQINNDAAVQTKAQQQVIDALRTQLATLTDNSAEEVLTGFQESANKHLWEDKTSQKQLNLARAVAAGQKKLAQIRETAAANVRKVQAESSAADQEAAKNDAARMQDIARREWAEYAKIVREGVDGASDSLITARVEDLRRQGKTGEAERLQIDADAHKRKAAIMRNAQEQAKAIGATGLMDPRRLGIMALAMGRILGVDAETFSRKGSVGLSEFEERAAKARELADLQAQRIPAAYDREKARIDAQYKYELDVAERAGKETVDIRARYGQEIANLDARFGRQRKDAILNIEEEISRARIEATMTGRQKELALTELDRQHALRIEADPATSTGVGAARINKLYDLKRLAELMPTFTARGTFNPFEATRTGLGDGGAIDRVAKASEKTADNTAEIASKIDNIGLNFGD
jgi:hypothetical protein